MKLLDIFLKDHSGCSMEKKWQESEVKLEDSCKSPHLSLGGDSGGAKIFTDGLWKREFNTDPKVFEHKQLAC